MGISAHWIYPLCSVNSSGHKVGLMLERIAWGQRFTEVAFLTHASPSMRGLEIARLRHAYYLQHDGEFQVHRVNCAVLARWNTPHPTLRNKRLLILQSQNRCPNVQLLNRFLPVRFTCEYNIRARTKGFCQYGWLKIGAGDLYILAFTVICNYLFLNCAVLLFFLYCFAFAGRRHTDTHVEDHMTHCVMWTGVRAGDRQTDGRTDKQTGWVPVGTEEEERRLSNSEKSSLDVPLDALNRSKLPGRETTRTQM